MSSGKDKGSITSLRIVTPAWKSQTNEDGSGLFFDIVRHVYEPAGIRMEYEIVPWKRAIRMLTYKEADAMLCAIRHTIAKADLLAPKYPMVVDNTVAVFKKEKIKEWKGTDTLKGKNLIWMLGYDLHKNQKFRGMKLKWEEVPSHYSAWKRLEADRNADIYIDSYFDVSTYIKTNQVDMTRYQIEILWGENAYMAFAKTDKSKKLIKIYDKRIIAMFKSGELEKIFKKWNLCPFPSDVWKN
jgi:polar amino acid transport system substrate-binding protein